MKNVEEREKTFTDGNCFGDCLMKQKFAFFDYDDTLIHGDSGRALLKYYLKQEDNAGVVLFLYR